MPFSKANRVFSSIIIGLLLGSLVMGVVTIVSIYQANNAVDALKTSSARNECRGQVKNDADDRFQHRLADLLDAAEHHDTLKVAAITRQIQAEIPVQQQVAANCPAPLVRLLTPTTSLSP